MAGEYGREYLDTHDEAVLYEALEPVLDGLEAVLEALAVRPLTSVEIADLLSTVLEIDADVEMARAYGDWLGALGYRSREDGPNELTRKGRRLIATTDGLTPPGTGGGTDRQRRTTGDGPGEGDARRDWRRRPRRDPRAWSPVQLAGGLR